MSTLGELITGGVVWREQGPAQFGETTIVLGREDPMLRVAEDPDSVRLVWWESVDVQREVELQHWPGTVRRELRLQSGTRWCICLNLHHKRHSELIAVLRFEDALAKARVLLWPLLVGDFYRPGTTMLCAAPYSLIHRRVSRLRTLSICFVAASVW